MTYVNRRTRLFLDRGDIRLERRRSESRLKKYPSAIDIRAWCDIVEDRRQHILELINKGSEKCTGKLIPIEAIIDALKADRSGLGEEHECAAKSRHDKERAEVDALTRMAAEDAVGTYKITAEGPVRVTTRIKGLQPGFQIGPGKTAGTITTRAQGSIARTSIKNAYPGGRGPQVESASVQPLPQEVSRAPILTASLIASPSTAAPLSAAPLTAAPLSAAQTPVSPFSGAPMSAGPISTVPTTALPISEAQSFGAPSVPLSAPPTAQPPISPAAVVQQGEFSTISASSPTGPQVPGGIEGYAVSEGATIREPAVIFNQAEVFSGVPSSQAREGTMPTIAGPSMSVDTGGAVREPAVAFIQAEVFSGVPSSQVREGAMPTIAEPSMRVDTGGVVGTSLPLRSADGDIIPAAIGDISTVGERTVLQQAPTAFAPGTYEPISAKEMAYATDISITGDVAMDDTMLRNLLAEQRFTIESLKNERNDLKNKLDCCLEELENAKKSGGVGSPLISSSCKEEIDALELEITEMRSGSLSPEQEAEVIKKEVEVLKKYCMKLKSVENENETLRGERDKLKGKVAISGIEVGINENVSDMGELNNKLDNLEELTRERDSLANRVQKLEKELLQYRDLPEDVEVYRNRSKMLDSALEERDKMGKKIGQIKDLEYELDELRKKAARVDELEEQLMRYTKNDRTAGIEMSKVKSRCTCLERELQNVKMERDTMYKRIECMKREIDNLQSKSKEAEMLKLERDRLQINLNELSHMQGEHETLRLKCKCLESAAQERDVYKQKYDEILSMECQCEMLRSQVDAARDMTRERDALVRQVGDLESCICEQEDEIKALVSQVDSLTQNKDEVQGRMKDALSTMRAEVEKKDCLIAASEEKLSAVQAQLKSSIQGVSCETSCLRTRLEELERENNQLQKLIKDNGISLNGVKDLPRSENESIAAVRRELEAAKAENKKLQQMANKMTGLTGDEHVQRMLKQSECAVKRVVEELGKQYKQWDYLKYNKIERFENNKDISDSESNEKLKEELDDIQREKEKLEKLVKQIQNDKFSCGPQQELISLRIDYANLQKQLQQEKKYREDLEKKLNK